GENSPKEAVIAATAPSHQPSFWLGSGAPTRRRPVPFDRVHQFAVLAVLALHMNRNDGVQRRNQKKGRKDEPKQEGGHNQDEVEDGGERLAVQKEGERRNENCKQIDHRPNPCFRHCRGGPALAAPQCPHARLVRGSADSANVRHDPPAHRIRRSCSRDERPRVALPPPLSWRKRAEVSALAYAGKTHRAA